MLYAFRLLLYFYFPCNYEEMESDVKKWENVENVSNLVSGKFVFICITTIFVNEIPDILLGLSLLVFPLHFENELSLDREYFRVKIGVAA